MGEVIRHLFFPHETNNHRPKALHIDALFLYVLFFAIFNFFVKTVHSQMPNVLGYATDIYANQLLDDVNAQRVKAGLTPLTLNSQLSDAAALKATDMFSNNYWAHNSPAGKTPWDFISSAGYKYSVAGENLAKNFSNSQTVVDAWMASPSHRENIMKPTYRDVGFAVVNGKLNGEETTLVVQMFGTMSLMADSTKPPVQTKQASVPVAASTPAVEVPKETVPVETTANPETAPAVLPVSKNTNQVLNENSGVTKKPFINLPVFTKYISYLFLGVITVIFLVDAYLVSRRRIIRVAGHNIGHVMFFGALIYIISMTVSGSIL
jgi:hypothetical protein